MGGRSLSWTCDKCVQDFGWTFERITSAFQLLLFSDQTRSESAEGGFSQQLPPSWAVSEEPASYEYDCVFLKHTAICSIIAGWSVLMRLWGRDFRWCSCGPFHMFSLCRPVVAVQKLSLSTTFGWKQGTTCWKMPPASPWYIYMTEQDWELFAATGMHLRFIVVSTLFLQSIPPIPPVPLTSD